MKTSLLFGVAAGAALIAGSFFYFWLEERRSDRQWISHRGFTTRAQDHEHGFSLRTSH